MVGKIVEGEIKGRYPSPSAASVTLCETCLSEMS